MKNWRYLTVWDESLVLFELNVRASIEFRYSVSYPRFVNTVNSYKLSRYFNNDYSIVWWSEMRHNCVFCKIEKKIKKYPCCSMKLLLMDLIQIKISSIEIKGTLGGSRILKSNKKKYHIFRTVPKSNRKIVETEVKLMPPTKYTYTWLPPKYTYTWLPP